MVAQTTPDSQRNPFGPEFRKLWAASAISNLGDGVALVAAPLLAASLTRDPILVAGLSVAQRIPWLLFPLVSGVLVDRLDRRHVIAAVAIFRSLLIGVLGVAILLDQASIPLLYAVFFLLGAGETVVDPASITILPAIVSRERLPQANARLTGTATILNFFAGPPLGGFLFAVIAAAPFLLGAGAFAAAAALLLALRGTFRVERMEGSPATTLRVEIAEGVGWLRRHRLLRTLALTLAVMNLTAVATGSIMVLFAQERLGLGPQGYGLLLSTEAIGGLAASVVAHRIIARLGPGRTLQLGLLIEAATPAIIVLAENPFVTGMTLTLFGFHAVTWGVLTTSLRQELIPSRLLGRVNSGYTTLGVGSEALGAPLGGLLAWGFGLAAPFWFASCAVALLTLSVWSVLGDVTVVGAKKDNHAHR